MHAAQAPNPPHGQTTKTIDHRDPRNDEMFAVLARWRAHSTIDEARHEDDRVMIEAAQAKRERKRQKRAAEWRDEVNHAAFCRWLRARTTTLNDVSISFHSAIAGVTEAR